MRKTVLLLSITLVGCASYGTTPEQASNALCSSLKRVNGGTMPNDSCPQVAVLAVKHYPYADFNLVAETSEIVCLNKFEAGTQEALNCYTGSLKYYSKESNDKNQELAALQKQQIGNALSAYGQSIQQQNAVARQNALNTYNSMSRRVTTNCNPNGIGGMSCTSY